MVLKMVQKSQIYFYLSLMLLLPAVGFSQETKIYVSPGFNLGYTFGEGFTRGLQITAGLVSLTNNEIAPNTHWSAGVTYGFKKSKLSETKYVDFQFSPFGLFGFGVGRAKIINRTDFTTKDFTHYKSWGGIFGLLQYDMFSSDDGNISYIGFTGVVPLVPGI